MNRDELLQLYDMTFDEKVIMLFKMFPKKQSYIEEVIESFPLINKAGMNISVSHEYVYYISLYVHGLCCFKKYWETAAYTDKKIYRFSYNTGDELTSDIASSEFDKDSSDILCDRVLPFILSRGVNRKSIPLIVHDFPEFAKFALEFNPEQDKPPVLRFIDKF